MKNEPTIEELEKLIAAFRDQGGSNAELSLLAHDVLIEYIPEKQRPLDDIFSKEDHPEISEIKKFKNNGVHPMKEAISKTWHKRYVKYPTAFIALFCVVFIILNLPLIIAQFQPSAPSTKYQEVKQVVQPVMAKSAPLEPGEVIPNGNFLVIPKINVDAPILYVNTYDETTIDANLSNGVVHEYNTANPGEVGNTFISGHSSNYWWIPGKYNYVFATLDRVNVGDQVIIYYQGNKYLYQAFEKEVVAPTDVSVLYPTTTPTLTLMTCTPPGTSWQRLIIKFNQISPTYIASKVVEKIQKVPSVNSLPSTNSNVFIDWIGKLLGF